MTTRFALTGAMLLGAAVGCGSPSLVERPCSPQGECLPGFRCRAGQCIPLSREVCDGEDNNGDGFIDENLYYPIATNTLPTRFIPNMAWNGTSFLAVWSQKKGAGLGISYALLDAQGGLQGSIADLGIETTGTANPVLAVSASSSGFLLAYSNPIPPDLQTADLVVVHFDTQGRLVAREMLGTFTAPTRLAVADLAGPAVFSLLNCFGPTCSQQGFWVYRPGAPPALVSEGVSPNSFGAAQSGDRIAFGWVSLPDDRIFCDGSPCRSADAGLLSVGKILIVGPEGTVSAEIPGATGLNLTWLANELIAFYLDERDGLHLRLALARFDASGRPLGEAVSVLEDVPALAVPGGSLSSVAGSSEVGVAWALQSSGGRDGTRIQGMFARVDPKRGIIGAPVALPVPLILGDTQIFFTGSQYAVLSPGQDSLTTIACLNTPPPGWDAGAPSADGGGSMDAGAPTDAGTPMDAGAPDAGPSPMGPLCSDLDPDGGAGVEGELYAPSGDPASGANVILGSCRVTADADGRFRAGGISIPYDLSVLIDFMGNLAVVSYLDLDTATPSIVLPAPTARPMHHSATVSGSWSPPADRQASLYLGLPSGEQDVEALGSGPFSASITWDGPSAIGAPALLLERSSAGDFTRAQLFAGLMMEDGMSTDLGALVPSDIASQVVSGRVPPAMSVQVRIGVATADRIFNVAEAGVSSTDFIAPAPVIGAAFPADTFLSAYLELSDGTTASYSTDPLLASTTDVQVTIPPAIRLISPAADATRVGSTPTFDFTPVDGAGFYFVVPESNGSFSLIFGAAPPLRTPDLGAFGFSFPAGVRVNWGAVAYLGPVGISDLASGFMIRQLNSLQPPGMGIRTSPQQSFTP
jgi:hypothetical protein